MNIITLTELLPLLDKAAVLEAVSAALIAHSAGEIQSPMPGELTFAQANGDCHIKYGHRRGADTFAIKVSTGFYDNEKLGLPVNNGLTMVFDAQTGMPSILFQDEGWLTAWRTVAATVLAVQIAQPKTDVRIGIIGTGLQGRLAGEWLSAFFPNATIALFGRNADRAETVAKQLGFNHAASADLLLAQSDIIVTTTPSTNPLFNQSSIREGMHFVGVGADSADKHELPCELFARAEHVVVDDIAQCSVLGDYGRAVRANIGLKTTAQYLGDALAAGGLARRSNDLSVVDLTGVAAQDIAMAALFAKLICA
jgi:ornithine cyclodeaminase